MKTENSAHPPRVLLRVARPRPRWIPLLAVALVGLVALAAWGVPAVGADPEDEHAELIAQMYEWRNDPQWAHEKAHTDRWDRALLAFGETVADASLTAMTATEAQALADSGLSRWVGVAAALWELEAPTQQQAEPPDQAAQQGAQAQQGVQAQQGSAITLVSNTGQTDSDTWAINTSKAAANGFTTGANAAGYTLTSIGVYLKRAWSVNFDVQLWSATDSGAPDSKLADLTKPTFTGGVNVNTTHTFTAPANTQLLPSTTYFVVLVGVNGQTTFGQTASSNEDAGAAAGWTISDNRYLRSSADGNFNPLSGSPLRFRVTGTVNPPPVLVSNLGQETTTNFGTAGYGNAVAFTTGSNAAGYTLSNIDLSVTLGLSAADVAALNVELWSAGSGGSPSSKLASLAVPAEIEAGTVSFAAPANTSLTASTTYSVVWYTGFSGTHSFTVDATTSADEDTGKADGWSIANQHHYWEFESGDVMPDDKSWQLNNASIFQFRVRGTAVTSTTSSNADLSALAASGSTDGSSFAALSGADALVPAFVSDTTGYRATVGNATTHVKVTPTVDDTGKATVKVGKSGETLTTVADGSASAAIPLDEGDNAITVEVTAEDSSTQEYTVNVRRVPSGSEWHATLTADHSQTIYFGCDDNDSSQDNCSTALTDNAFTYGSADYTVAVLYWDSDENLLILEINKGGERRNGAEMKADLGALALNLDGAELAISNADGGSGDDNLSWSYTPATAWTDGSQVSLSLGVATSTTSSNADLSALAASGSMDGSSFTALSDADALVPAFASDTTGYRATVGYTTTHVQVTPTVDDTGKATVKVGKAGGTLAPVTDGSASVAIALDVGDNAITVEVTAEDTSTQEYTVTVRRSPAGSSWHATFVPGTHTLGSHTFVGCNTETSCTSQLTDNSFTIGSANKFARLAYRVANTFVNVDLANDPSMQLQALKFCAGDAAMTIGSSRNISGTRALGWAESAPASLSIGTHCTGKLGTPTGLMARTASATSATVSWNRGAGPTTQDYTLEYRVPGNSNSRFWNNQSGSTVTVTNSRPAGDGWEYRVRAKAGGGYQASDWSAWVTEGTPTITLTSNAASDTAAEGDSPVTITATLSEAAPSSGVTVTLATAGTATSGSANDYTLSTSTIMIAANGTSGTASLTIVDDTAVEANETVVLSGTNSGYTAGSLTVTITDNDTAAKPTALVANGANAKLDVSWTAPAGVLTGYGVHYTSASADDVADTATVRTDSDDTAGWVDASHTGTTASHSITSLTNDTEYRVRVRGLSAAGDGAWEFATGTPTSSLVSNFDQNEGSPTLGSAAIGEDLSIAQGFTTGANPGGYTLSGIEIQTTLNPTPAQSRRIKAEVWEAASGVPGTTRVHTMPEVQNINSGTVVFPAPAAAALKPSTQYFFVLYNTNNYAFTATTIDDDDEDTGGSAGWSITDGHHTVAAADPSTLGSNSWAAATDGYTMLISVKGAEVPSVPVSLSASPNPVTEGSAVTVTATLDAALDADVTIPLTITDGTTGSGDRGTLSGITITAGETTGTGEITTTDDKVDEENETFTVALDEANLPSSVSAGTPKSVQITINDNDTRGVTVSETSRTVEAGETTSYTVVLNSQPTANVVITPTSSDTAKATVSGAMTFTTSNWDQTQTVTITGKAAGTGLKVTHAVTTSTDSKYPTSLPIAEVGLTVTASTKTYEITSAPATATAEGSSASLTVTLGRTAPTGGIEFDVIYSYSGSTATSADTGTTSSTVTVNAGATTATLSVPIAQDDLVEGPETFTAKIDTSVVGWQPKGVGKDTSTITISETEGAKIAFGNSPTSTAKLTPSAGEGSAMLDVPVTIDHLPQADTTFTITLLTTGTNRATRYTDTANPGNGDFYIETLSVTFGPATAKTQNVTVTIRDDDVVEYSEIIPLRIADSASGLGQHYQRNTNSKDATVTITDNEGAKIAFGSDAKAMVKLKPSVDADMSVDEDVTGATLNVPVTIDHLPQDSTTFTIEVLNTGTATEYASASAPGDFRIATKSVTFRSTASDTATTKDLSIALTNDVLVENDQTIELRIAAARASSHIDYDLSDLYARNAQSRLAQVVIDDDEAEEAKAAFGTSAGAEAKHTVDVDEEVTAGSVKVPITISHLPEVSTEFQVQVLAASTALEYTDTANPGNGDFHIATKKVTFDSADTELTKNVTITIRNDALVENDQTIELEIHQGTGFFTKYGRDGNGKLAAVTIEDDDRDDRDGAKIAFGDDADAEVKLTPSVDSNMSVDENVTAGKLLIPVTVGALPDEDTDFTVEVRAAGTATEYADSMNPGDFRVSPKTVTFGPGTEKTVNLAVTINNDALVENDQTIELRIEAVAAAPGTVGSYSDLGDYYSRHSLSRDAQAKIVDDDRGAAKIAFGSSAGATTKLTPSVDEEVAAGTLSVPVTISHLPEEDTTFTVRVLTTGTATEYANSATPGRDDFHIADKELDFTKSSSPTQNIAITVNNDDVVENDQTVQLQIVAVAASPGTEGAYGDLGDYYDRHASGSLATVTIADDDRDTAKVALHGSDSASEAEFEATAAEGGTITVPVSVSHRPQEAVTFTLEVTGGKARETDETANPTGNPKDYVIASKTVTFAAGDIAAKSVTVNIEDDRVEEDTETITVRIKPAAAAPGTVGAYGDLGDYYTRHADGSAGTLTITDDDEVAEVALSINRTMEGTGYFVVLEGSLVTVTATADIPVGPRGWKVTAENTHASDPRFSLIFEGCQRTGNWPGGYACPNDYTLPSAFTIAEGQTTATATLRLAADSRNEAADERLGLRATATRTPEGSTERELTTNELDLRIRQTGKGISLSTASMAGLVPGETATYTVALRGGAPTHDVTVTPTSAATGKATVSCAADPCVLTFTPDNWADPQEITVTAVAAGSAAITHAVSSDDSSYGALGSTGRVDVTVETAVQNFRIQPSATGAEGETVELTVTLGAVAPTGGLELAVSRARTSDRVYVGSQNPPPTVSDDDDLAVDADRGTAPTTLTVPAGQRTATLSDPFADDDLVEGPEHYYVTLSTSVSGWAPAAVTNTVDTDYETCDETPTCARVTINDADTDGARVWVGPAAGGPITLHRLSAGEGAGTASVPVSVNRLPSKDTVFAIEVMNTGSATEGSAGDYTIATKSVTFGPGTDATQNVTVTINDDSDAEGAEEVRLRIADADNPAADLGDYYRRGPAGRSQGILTINDNDGSVMVSATSIAVSKNGAGTYTVRLVGANPGGTVTIAVVSGDTDKATVRPATLNFTAANQPQTVTVTGVDEGSATISHTISTGRTAYPTNLSIGSVDVTVTAQPTASLAVSPNPVPEGNSVTVTLTLSKALGTTATIPIVLTAGTADTGDYGSLANITVSSTGTVFTGTITTDDDADTEDETFTVALGTLPSSVARGTPDSVEVTIQDGDTNTVSLSASSSTVGEGETVTITATLTQPLSNPIVIPLTVTAGTAGDADYTVPALKEIRIAAGERTGTFEIETVEDQADEPNETFTVALGSPLPDEVVAGTRSVTVTIDDGDPNRVSLSAAPNPVGEGETVTITATLERVLTQNVDIPFTITNGTAADADYTAPATKQISITAGQTSGTIQIRAVHDADASEGDETFTVALGSPLPEGVSAGTSSVEVTISDRAVRLPPRPPRPPGPRPDPPGGGGGGGSAQSDNADLRAVSLAGGGGPVVLAQVFSAGTTAYTADVAHDTDQITIDADPAHTAAEVAIEPADADPDAPGHQVNLDVGPNTITVAVTAQDDTQKTYTVTVTRAPQPDSVVTQQDIELRDDLVFTQEALLNAYRCLFDVDAHIVPGGCNGTVPAQQPAQPAPFEGTPTAEEQELRDRLVSDQEALLNAYRCMFDVDTHIVPGGCIDGRPAEPETDTAAEDPADEESTTTEAQ